MLMYRPPPLRIPAAASGTMTFSDQTNEADAITMIERFAAAPPPE